MPDAIRIANACAFWGDDPGAAARLIAAEPNIDYITLDYLAEVSMSILAKLQQRDPSAGYAQDFVEVIKSLVPAWQAGGRFRIITNAGGLNPAGCAKACADVLKKAGLPRLKIGVVTGDDVLPIIRSAFQKDPETSAFSHLETGQRIAGAISDIVTANAYLGAAPVAEALRAGAQIVITGRLADPSLTVGPCIAHFNWTETDLNPLAGSTVAGHLIECGTQVCGGISTEWLALAKTPDIGFPIVEMERDGSCIVTKPPNTGGAVNERTVKEQLLYEIGDPENYLSPDVIVSFLTLNVQDLGDDRVRVSGATGRRAPETLKVSATIRAGFRASAMLTIVGRDAVAKARQCGQMVLEKLRRDSREPRRFNVECLGSGDVVPGVLPRRDDLFETVLRLTACDEDREVIEHFSRQIVPLVTAGPQGTTGYFDGRPAVRELFEYWPCLIDGNLVRPNVQIVEG